MRAAAARAVAPEEVRAARVTPLSPSLIVMAVEVLLLPRQEGGPPAGPHQQTCARLPGVPRQVRFVSIIAGVIAVLFTAHTKTDAGKVYPQKVVGKLVCESAN